jgi:hypothetical protein
MKKTCVVPLAARLRANHSGYSLVEVLRAKISSGGLGQIRRASGAYFSQDVFPADKYKRMFSAGTRGHSYVLMDLKIHWLVASLPRLAPSPFMGTL